MQTKSVTYQNATIFYKVAGTGRQVVLVHGFGESSTVWQHQVEFLKPYFQLIVPDLPGSGTSQLVNDADIETYAAIIKAILDAEPPQTNTVISSQEKITKNDTPASTAMIGHSMGGYITLSFAQHYPGYLGSAGLVHSSAFADTEEKKDTRRKAIAFINTSGAQAFIKKSTPSLFTADYVAKYPEKITALVAEGHNFTESTLIQYYQAMIKRPDRTAVLKDFSGPVLFVIGEQDTAVPLQTSLQQSHLPVQSYVHLLHHTAHMGLWEEKDKVNTILFDFLSGESYN